jgi:hypothetical protein
MVCLGLSGLVYKRAPAAGVPAHHFLMRQRLDLTGLLRCTNLVSTKPYLNILNQVASAR